MWCSSILNQSHPWSGLIQPEKIWEINICPLIIKTKVAERSRLRKRWQNTRSAMEKQWLNAASIDLQVFLIIRKTVLAKSAPTDYSLWKAIKKLMQPQQVNSSTHKVIWIKSLYSSQKKKIYIHLLLEVPNETNNR